VKSRYSMLIQWSEEDQVYVVSFPEFGPYAKTHGATYALAAKSGQEVLELLTRPSRENGGRLPEPLTLNADPDLCQVLETYRGAHRGSTLTKAKKKNGTAVEIVRRRVARHADR
jgi:predicted RNase H-like HicB family nuclease